MSWKCKKLPKVYCTVWSPQCNVKSNTQNLRKCFKSIWKICKFFEPLNKAEQYQIKCLPQNQDSDRRAIFQLCHTVAMIYQGRTAPVLFALTLDSTRVQTSRVSSLAWPWWSVANFWPEGLRLICVKMFDTYCVFHFDRFVKATISWLNLNVSVYKKKRTNAIFVCICCHVCPLCTRSATNSKFRRKKHWSFTKEPCVEGFTGGYVHSLVDQILS